MPIIHSTGNAGSAGSPVATALISLAPVQGDPCGFNATRAVQVHCVPVDFPVRSEPKA
jgi:hypothetical protein